MKKLMLFFMIFTICCGCSNKSNRYENYQHYNIENYKEINSYTFYSDNGTEMYVVADISPEKAEGRDNAIFYKIEENDYILLDQLSVDNYYANLPNPEKYTYFYYDKYTGEKRLFIVRNLGNTLLEYKFNEEKFEKIDLRLKLDFSSITSDPLKHVEFSSIEKVDSENIYYRGHIKNDDKYNLGFKCSLSSYKCELYN